MCRLFGFRSVVNLRVHHSLKHAENALAKQSVRHSDGWGVGYYLDDRPILRKRANAAFQDYEYARISEVVSSRTVLAHIRKATVGEMSERNSHPFMFKRWIFAHNGHIEDFHKIQADLLSEIPEELVENIQGHTDSEHLFHLFLAELSLLGDLDDPNLKSSVAMVALSNMLGKVDRWVEEYRPGIRSETNILVTNGSIFLALRRGSPLFYSTQKKSCADLDSCPRFKKECLGALPTNGQINHILISSEPISSEDLWQETPQASVLAIDRDLNWRIEPILQREERRDLRSLLPIVHLDANYASADRRFKGDVALLCGSNSPLKLASGRVLSAEGARLILHETDAKGLLRMKAQFQRLDADIFTEGVAGQHPSSLSELVQHGIQSFGQLNIIVAHFEGLSPVPVEEEIVQILDVLQMHLVQQSLGAHLQRDLVRIVIVLHEEAPNLLLRARLRSFIQEEARRFSPWGVRINSICTSFIKEQEQPPSLLSLFSGVELPSISEVPLPTLGRRGRPEEIAQAIAFLASREASFVNGTLLEVDGGTKHPL